MDYVLKTEALTKVYGHHKVLDNFSMHIPQGAIYGLVGKNGAGKTTLLRIICGLQEATSGDYSLYGISSRKHEILNARKEMGAVIETPAIYCWTANSGHHQQHFIVSQKLKTAAESRLKITLLSLLRHLIIIMSETDY